ncbi:MAG: C4-dicarboxylate ABC transporter substrate-binding protein [Betaproteobacteria bacterium]|nr:C4-dicarboxylate ABC transporter substrate-binding protein [Betaproteobacteria bacterium]
MRRINLRTISKRDLALIVIPVLLAVVLAFVIAYQFVKPAPPDSFVISTGSESGAYHAFAKRYQKILARQGITLELRPSSGSVENLKRLRDNGAGVDAGFYQSGTGNPADNTDTELFTLGSVYYEPVWVFYRGARTVDRLLQIRGRRIAVGPPGSGSRMLATQLLSANEAARPPTQLLDLSGDAAALALRRGAVDAVLAVGGPESKVVRDLLADRQVRLMSFNRAAAYTRKFPFLTAVTLPHGSIDLVHDVPPADTLLLAPSANILVREGLHPALVDLLMQAIAEVHGSAGVFQKPGEFPSVRDSTFPSSPEAQRFYKAGPPFLQRYLPFWAATLIDRIVVLLVPLIVVLLPAIRFAPALYTWRIRSIITKWYGELKLLEIEIKEHFAADRNEEFMKRLNALENLVNTRPIPLRFTDQLYTLRQHIQMVRDILLGTRPPGAA